MTRQRTAPTAVFTALCGLAVFSANAAAGESWPQFRGPRGDGHSDATGLPLEFGDATNVRWKTPIHGRGWSSPVVLGDEIWLTTATADGKKMYGVCVNAGSGRVQHDLLLFENAKPRFRHATNSYASPTPVVEQGRVYLHFGSYGTCCLDTQTGKKLWERRDLTCNHFRGPGSSPVMFGNLLIANYDGFDCQYVVALDKRTGKTVWKKDRDIDYGTDNGDYKKAYCTPHIIDTGSRKELISPAAIATIAYDPASGRELWRVRHGGMNAAARPLFGHNLVYIAAGDGGMRLVAVRPGGTGDVTGKHVAWKSGRNVAKRSSQLLVGNLFFMISDTGVASCRNALTGKAVWEKRLPGGTYWASPVLAENRIYFFSKNGKAPVIAAGRRFALLAENEFPDGFNASPAIVGKSLIVRSMTHLYCIEKKSRPAGPAGK